MITLFGKTISKTGLINGFNASPYCVNPSGKGTSEIVKVSDTHIWYKRGKTTMRISIELINNIFDHIDKNILIGTKIYGKDIVNIKNKVAPNYKGWHNCDASFIMMLLRYILNKPIYDKKPVYIII